jgi:hypothetical protein
MFDEIDLHDGIIKSLIADYGCRKVTILIDYYDESGGRVAAEFVFSGVQSMHHVGSFDALHDNSISGNVNYWLPDEGGDSFIYLCDGCIVINSQKISISRI